LASYSKVEKGRGWQTKVTPDLAAFLSELDMLYLAIFPGKAGNFLNTGMLEAAPNRLSSLLADPGPGSEAVRVIDVAEWTGGNRLKLNADAQGQRAMVFFDKQLDLR
jgi:hypothetical protein